MCPISLYFGRSIHRSFGVWTLVLLLTWATQTGGFRCKWSNEGCASDEECCSKSCELPHPGTNPRCTKSPLHGKCIFPFQCADRLQCSRERYQCCSPYWGSCMVRKDCCDRSHLCVPAAGFIYRRCLLKEVTAPAPTTEFSWAVTGLGIMLSQLISLFTTLSMNSTSQLAYNVTGTTRPSR